MSDQVYLFANGTQYMDWSASNCDKCAKAGDPGEAGSSMCDLFEAIHDAACMDGTVTPAVATRLGKHHSLVHVWPCPEFRAPDGDSWDTASLDTWAQRNGYANYAAYVAGPGS
jgi:hypothetical protein